MDTRKFLEKLEECDKDFTLNTFLEEGFGLAATYKMLSDMYERGVIAETERKGHFSVCAEIRKIAEVVNAVASDDVVLFTDAFSRGEAKVTIRLENYSGVGFEIDVLSGCTPAEIVSSIDYEEHEDFDHLFLDPYDMLSFDKESHVLDESRSSFILEKGDELIRMDFQQPLCSVQEFRDIYYAKVIPDFIVSVCCVYIG